MDFTTTIIPLALMAPESIDIDSEPTRAQGIIVKYHFTVVRIVSMPLSESEAETGLVLIQISFLMECMLKNTNLHKNTFR